MERKIDSDLAEKMKETYAQCEEQCPADFPLIDYFTEYMAVPKYKEACKGVLLVTFFWDSSK